MALNTRFDRFIYHFKKNILLNLRICIFCCTSDICLAKSYCYYLSSYHILGGRAYPVRHYPIAVRLRTLAFGNMVAMIVAPVNIRATCASALPTPSRSSYLPSVERLFRGDPIIYIAPFYVLRLILRVGTLRAQHSECVPSHSFTHDAVHTPVRSKFYKKIGYALIIRYPSSHFQASLNE